MDEVEMNRNNIDFGVGVGGTGRSALNEGQGGLFVSQTTFSINVIQVDEHIDTYNLSNKLVREATGNDIEAVFIYEYKYY